MTRSVQSGITTLITSPDKRSVREISNMFIYMTMLCFSLLLLVHIPVSSGTCPAIREIENGSYDKSDRNNVSSVVTFRCNTNYSLGLEDHNVLICLSNGEWTSEPPTCYRACDKPSGVKINGSFEGKHGSKINFTCSTGFKGDAECKNGTWWMDCKPGITCFPSHVKDTSKECSTETSTQEPEPTTSDQDSSSGNSSLKKSGVWSLLPIAVTALLLSKGHEIS